MEKWLPPRVHRKKQLPSSRVPAPSAGISQADRRRPPSLVPITTALPVGCHHCLAFILQSHPPRTPGISACSSSSRCRNRGHGPVQLLMDSPKFSCSMLTAQQSQPVDSSVFGGRKRVSTQNWEHRGDGMEPETPEIRLGLFYVHLLCSYLHMLCSFPHSSD